LSETGNLSTVTPTAFKDITTALQNVWGARGPGTTDIYSNQESVGPPPGSDGCRQTTRGEEISGRLDAATVAKTR